MVWLGTFRYFALQAAYFKSSSPKMLLPWSTLSEPTSNFKPVPSPITTKPGTTVCRLSESSKKGKDGCRSCVSFVSKSRLTTPAPSHPFRLEPESAGALATTRTAPRWRAHLPIAVRGCCVPIIPGTANRQSSGFPWLTHTKPWHTG